MMEIICKVCGEFLGYLEEISDRGKYDDLLKTTKFRLKRYTPLCRLCKSKLYNPKRMSIINKIIKARKLYEKNNKTPIFGKTIIPNVIYISQKFAKELKKEANEYILHVKSPIFGEINRVFGLEIKIDKSIKDDNVRVVRE